MNKYKYSNLILHDSKTGEIQNPKCERCNEYKGIIYTETCRQWACLRCYKVEIISETV